MKFQIFNVGHGFCAEATASNGNLLMFDCGFSDDWRPSTHFKRRASLLVIGNYDEDHVGDVANVEHKLGVDFLQHNQTITADELRRLKLGLNGEVSPAMEHMVGMMRRYTGSASNNNGGGGGVSNYQLQKAALHPGIGLSWHWNSHQEFGDTNNLSVVTFVEMGGHKFIVTGDMERAGWKALLRRPGFCKDLAGVTVFIASHHGRESGYCEEVFDIATKVQVVVVSDCEKQFETQEMCSTYAKHAGGIGFNGKEVRRVLTTRSDGTIHWDFSKLAQVA